MRNMQIVQLSDIHIGSLFNQNDFDTLVEESENLKPDAIIITCDLTDDGLLFQFERDQIEINKLACPNKIVLAGNHDNLHTLYVFFYY
jgi:Icc protein